MIPGQRVQRRFAQSLWVAFASLSPIDDRLGYPVARWVVYPISLSERCHSRLKSEAHQARGLPVESLTVQVRSDWHGDGNLFQTCRL
jgi:hypothetical protein